MMALTLKVGRGTPAVLPPMQMGLPENRLGLAKWLTSPEHPLTARVQVNRFWQMLFGTGLVKTVDDFGSQGEPPTHPALLDWLALEYQQRGWNTKALLKTLVMSATYRQSSKTTPRLLQLDPDNRLLARGPRLTAFGGDDPRPGTVCVGVVGGATGRAFGEALSAGWVIQGHGFL
ncbi:MAG: DUF1553 domain-containing protein [Pyrinomonadaceae bacterium]